MALEELASEEIMNYIIYETVSASCNASSETSILPETNCFKPPQHTAAAEGCSVATGPQAVSGRRNTTANCRRKRRRRVKVCKSQEEAETQRMTHIAVERNRRRQMNEHLSALRSLMPDSYVQRGDQASIVGGAIEYVKELEHLLQSLEAQKFLLLQEKESPPTVNPSATHLAQFFSHPQYYCSQIPNKYTSRSRGAVADIEVTLIETHANLRILFPKITGQLWKMVAGFQNLCLTILHLNLTTLGQLVLCSINAKVEEGCQLGSADEIADAVNHMLRIIEEESALC
ncbi:hypothetical protein NMG60_11030104 [Bertholletia excelsa]